MVRTRYGKTFRTRRGRYGRYKYVNGRRVSFVSSKRRQKIRTYSYRGKRHTMYRQRDGSYRARRY